MTKLKKYKYSIIMPVYNAETTLSKSVLSIINQDYDNWEFIIIDDGSTDDSLKILKEYEKKNHKIILKSQKNLGPGLARNNGIELATGDYVVFIDSDDYYEKDFLSIVNKENNNIEYDLLFISTLNENKNGKIMYNDNLIKYMDSSKDELIGLQLAGIFPWGPCSKVVKRDIIKTCKFSNCNVGEEAIYSYNIMKKVNKYTFIKKPLYHYVHTEFGQHKKGGLNPWGPIVDGVKKILIEDGNYIKYENYINCLTLKAFCIYIYRVSYTEGIAEAIKNIRKEHSCLLKHFKNIKEKHLDKTTKLILILLKMRMYLILVLLSKVKYIIQMLEEKKHG